MKTGRKEKVLTTNRIANEHIAIIPVHHGKTIFRIHSIDYSFINLNKNMTTYWDSPNCLDTELGSTPVSALVVILDFSVSLHAKPLRDRLILLLCDT
jgi:hypothetical protein